LSLAASTWGVATSAILVSDAAAGCGAGPVRTTSLSPSMPDADAAGRAGAEGPVGLVGRDGEGTVGRGTDGRGGAGAGAVAESAGAVVESADASAESADAESSGLAAAPSAGVRDCEEFDSSARSEAASCDLGVSSDFAVALISDAARSASGVAALWATGAAEA
jgi:hypothetical protein